MLIEIEHDITVEEILDLMSDDERTKMRALIGDGPKDPAEITTMHETAYYCAVSCGNTLPVPIREFIEYYTGRILP